MIALIIPNKAATMQVVERQVAQLLQNALQDQKMTDADWWLYSVWQGTTNWFLLERLLADNTQVTSSIPVLIGCLQIYKQQQLDDRQANLLKKIDTLAYEQAISRLRHGKVGMLTGGAASLHYLLKTGAYSTRACQYVEQLTEEVVNRLTSYVPTTMDLSIGNGQTGLLLSLIEAVRIAKTNSRIQINVRKIEEIVNQYVRYLSEHQIPIDSTVSNCSVFPTLVSGSEWNVTEGLGWDVGDVGQLLLLYQVYQLYDQPEILRWADRLSGYLLQVRSLNKIQVNQPGLANGMAGLSLLYRRLYLLTSRTEFLTEGKYWFEQLIESVVSKPTNYVDPSLLTGVLGIEATVRQWADDKLGLDLLFF